MTQCLHCGKEFAAKSPRAKYCSPYCRYTYRNRHEPPRRVKDLKTCPVCGYRGMRKHIFCERHDPSPPPKPCWVWMEAEVAFLREYYPTLGSTEVARQIGRTPTQVRDKASKLHLHLTAEATKTIVNAAAAKHMREHNPSKLPGAAERMRKTSSTPERIAKLAEGRARALRDKPSGLETRFAGTMRDLGIEFESQVFIKPKFVVDFRVSGSLIIQVDGDWWHGHPRFENPLPRQIAQQARDHAQDAYLTTCGYTVARIWESDCTPENIRSLLIQYQIIAAS